jgi:kynurenine formamidase
MTRLLMTASLVIACGCARPAPPAAPFPQGDLVDLSHPYDDKTVVWPTSEFFRLETLSAGMTGRGYYYAANNLFAPEHGGTHIDAPIHFAQGRMTVDRIPLRQLIAEAVVVDVTGQTAINRDYQISIDDVTAWEREHGEVPRGAIVLFRTGFSRHWPDAAAYLGTAERGDAGVAALHFPGVHPTLARWLADNRSPGAIGIDTASIDYGQSTLYESHVTLFERDIPAFENLTALARLPARGAYVVALPMKIAGGTGGPLRAVAILPR